MRIWGSSIVGVRVLFPAYPLEGMDPRLADTWRDPTHLCSVSALSQSPWASLASEVDSVVVPKRHVHLQP